MATPAQGTQDPLSEFTEQDIAALGQQRVDFLRDLATFLSSAGTVAEDFEIFWRRDNGGHHCMGKLETLATGKYFHLVSRNLQTPGEYVVKVQRTNDDPTKVLPPDDPQCGWVLVGGVLKWVCRS